MEIKFFNSKSGERTCTVNSKFLHSKYSPAAEAEKFVNSIPPVNPELIILVSPGLPYCYNKLKSRFPGARIAAVNFSPLLSNKLWDYEWVPNEYIQLNTFLNDILCSFDLKKIHIEIWHPSLNIWPEEIQNFQILLKEVINTETAVNTTRKYFGKRWFKNILRNILFIEQTINLKRQIESPVLIAAAGQSLEDKINLLNSGYFFNIAVTSASGFLCYNDLKPDLFFITDGGYWAKEQFMPMYFANNTSFLSGKINLAISMEAAIPAGILSKNNILPLSYKSPFTESILKLNNIGYLKAMENGTVTGTALDFALEYSNKKIYLAGLDLGPGKNSFHARPGVQETRNRNETSRTSSLWENIPLHSEQMDIYKNWFENLSRQKKQRINIVVPCPVKIQSINKIEQEKLISMINTKQTTNPKDRDLFSHYFISSDKKNNTINYLKGIILKAGKYTISDYFSDEIFFNISSYIDWENYTIMENYLKTNSKTQATEAFENIKNNCIDFINNEIKRYERYDFF